MWTAQLSARISQESAKLSELINCRVLESCRKIKPFTYADKYVKIKKN